MKSIFNILTLGIQLGLTFVLTVSIYLVFALLDYEGGFDGFVGLTLFQPIMAVILSALTIFYCLIIGLPIRLIWKLNSWWTQHFYLAILLTFIGLTMLGLSFTPQFIEINTITIDGLEITKDVPNAGLAITGWLLTAFSTLHIYPPKRLTKKVQDIFTNLIGRKIKNAHQHRDG